MDGSIHYRYVYSYIDGAIAQECAAGSLLLEARPLEVRKFAHRSLIPAQTRCLIRTGYDRNVYVLRTVIYALE